VLAFWILVLFVVGAVLRLSELRRAGLTVLLVEQNARQALRIADRAYLLETGRIVRAAPASELLASPAVVRAYLGGL